jgi:hypothetical protein
VFQIVLPKALAISVIPLTNYGLAAETLFRTKRPSNSIFGLLGYLPFIVLIFMYRVIQSSSYGLPMKDEAFPFFAVTGFTTFKILLSAYCVHMKNSKATVKKFDNDATHS